MPFQEHIIVGVPLIIFFGLIALYLSAQLQLYLVATALITSTITVFCLSLSSWSVLEQSVSYNNNFLSPSRDQPSEDVPKELSLSTRLYRFRYKIDLCFEFKILSSSESET